MLHPSLRCGRSFGMPGGLFRPLPFFGRTVAVRRRRHPEHAFDAGELVRERTDVFRELWLEAWLKGEGFDVVLCPVHRIYFTRGKACSACAARKPAKEAGG